MMRKYDLNKNCTSSLLFFKYVRPTSSVFVCVCVVGVQVNVRVCVCVNGTSKGDSRLWSIQVCCPEIALCCCLYPLISSASPTVKWVHTHSGTHKAPPPPLPAPHCPTPLLQLLPSAWNRWRLFLT